MIEIAGRIAAVKDRIEGALQRARRPAGSVTLVAVSKTCPAAAVVEAIRAGQSVFGENRVQEAAAKRPAVAALPGGEAAEWHLVGHLQSNKAKAAAALFDLVHSVDDAELAAMLDRACATIGKRLPVLIQVNVASEAAKSGVAPAGLLPLVEKTAGLANLSLQGLMTIPPWDPDPEKSRPHFVALRELGERVRTWLGAGAHYAGELSMGMSEDFEVAIEEGATIVRVGRAIFGERLPPRPSLG